MSIKKAMIFVSMVFILAAASAGQTTAKYSDDRELFIGVAGGGVMPNIMILADNSISMTTAIYHPNYNMNLFYNHANPTDPNSAALSLDLGSNNFGTYNGSPSLTSTKTFNICGSRGTYHLHGTYEASFVKQARKKPKRYWEISVIGGNWKADNIVGQTVWWGCSDTPNSCTHSAPITAVVTTSPLVIEVNPAPTNDPAVGQHIYIGTYWELSSATTNTATFIPNTLTCASQGFATTIHSNVTLYGTQVDGSYPIIYDLNYLYWLAFHASNTDIAEVTHWATTGAFKHDSGGVHVFAGYCRIMVEKAVLYDVISELWTKRNDYNFGLASFANDSEGANLLNNMQNATNLTGSLNVFQNSINGLRPTTMTPLAEALADIWAYFKCGGGPSSWNYQPESDTNDSGCGRLAGSFPPASCPIQQKCQKNYVIIMTDGRSTDDNFTASKYAGAIFRNPVNGVNGVGGWGDGDSHNPPTYNGTQPTTFTPAYCPNETCWKPGSSGTDFLDDVAYYIYKNDIFPDDIRPQMTGKQNIETFTIGFSVDNDLLKETAKNGNGEYYTANDYAALKAALSSAITNIMLRNFAFSSYTAPKRVTTAVGEGASFVGYFMPSDKEVWDGHLQSYTMYDKWFANTDGIDGLSPTELSGDAYDLQATCQSISGKKCLQTVSMGAHPNWDATDQLASLPTDRNLYFLNLSSGTPTTTAFSDANISTLQGFYGFKLPDDNPLATDPLLYHNQALTIISEISSKLNFGDVFHSDIAYVGAPLKGKMYLQNYNPTPECVPTALNTDPDCYQKFREDNSDRRKVIYVGTNVGIVHMIDANTPIDEGGKEIWGFIPDEVLPTLKTIALDKKFSYTTDGRMTADDIYVHGAATDAWKTILTFGLKDGGQSFYALDITHVPTAPPFIPTFFWKFKSAEYSGNSWSKPIIGKILFNDGTSSYDRWVVVVAGGRAFNNEDPSDSKGKAIFVLDAATGDVIWMIGYNSAGGADDVTTTPELEVNKTAYANPASRPSGQKHLTKDAAFNYCVPSAISAIDKDNNGYLDTIYFGNVAGHLFKVNLANPDPTNWKTYAMYKTDLTAVATGTIALHQAMTPASQYTINVSSGAFTEGSNVIGLSSNAMGFISEAPVRSGGVWIYTIQVTSAGSYTNNEPVAIKPYDPIFLAPAVYIDSCSNYWVNFGTGDRLRSRTNPTSGKFLSIRDVPATPSNLTTSNLVPLTFSTTTNGFTGSTNIKVDNKWGWYFNFPDTANHEKLFDPDPVVLPDQYFLPHIYFNTYQYNATASSPTDCNAPSAGTMHFYEITVDYCNTGAATGYREAGRISGGGMMEGSEYIMVEGTSDVGSVDLPGLGGSPKILPKPLPYTGGLLFLREKKR